MISSESRKRAVVRRITVDEKLSDDLVRLLVCKLKTHPAEFHDRPEDWGEERFIFVKSSNYIKKMGIPSSKLSQYQWANFREGQVFLSGQFDFLGDEKFPEKFIVNPKQESFLRIDDLVRENIKQLYFRALERR